MKRPFFTTILNFTVILVMALGFFPVPQAAAVGPKPPTTTLHLSVVSARAWVPAGLTKGMAIPHYRWTIMQDDTGDPTFYTGTIPMGPSNPNYPCTPPYIGGDPAYPANCQWPSIHSVKGGTSAEVVAEGDETTLNTTTGLTLPAGKYMITVRADGFTVPGCTVTPTVNCQVSGFMIDGNWFSVPLNNPGADPGLVTVAEQPDPLPLLTVRVKVFEDTTTNGAYDDGEPFLVGWEGHLNDIMGEVTTDWYGNPLCTVYQHDAGGLLIFGGDGRPLIQTMGGHCYSDANGEIAFPYLGPNRYSATVVPPNGQVWFQTSSLEGSHDWDIWAQAGWNGYDPEFVPGGEPFPFSWFSFVRPTYLAGHPDTPTSGNLSITGALKGVVVQDIPYTPPAGGLPFGGEAGNAINGPVANPVITLVDMLANDQLVWVGQGNADGTFQINHIPDGDYSLAYWDEPQNYLMETINLRISNGQLLDMGTLDDFPWFSTVHGKVCQDLDRNGKCDPSDPGIPNLAVTMLSRDNSLQDQGIVAVQTDNDGNYNINQAYPLGQWVVTQAYFENYYTVGVTYQSLNQPSETTVLAPAQFVDVSTFNQVGQITRLDWAVHTYETDPAIIAQGYPSTGGLVGEMVYNTTRIESDPRFQSSQDNEPGIPNFPVHLYWPVPCDAVTGAPTNPSEPFTTPAGGVTCTRTETAFGVNYYLTSTADGAYIWGPEANDPYISEAWRRPKNCLARDVNMLPVVNQVLPTPYLDASGNPVQAPNPADMHDCLEGPLMGNQTANQSFTDADGVLGDGQYVNGNYGFTQVTTDITGAPIAAGAETIPSGDWIVVPQVPTDPFTNKPLWRATMEEDINLFTGDWYVAPGETPNTIPTPARPVKQKPITPQIPPYLCIGPLHTVNVVSNPTTAHFDPLNPSTTQGVYNPDFLANAGSPYEGQRRPLCNEKMVTVRAGRSATPNFYWQPTNDVPLPGRIYGLVVDDLNLSVNPQELYFGEKAGIALPIGIYDFANRLITTVHSDRNGAFEVLLPSSLDTNCPLPASMCPGVYRFVANDPGQPGALNPDFKPQYRTIAVFNQVWPGITLPADLAPVPAAPNIEGPGVQQATQPQCLVNDPVSNPTAPLVPEIFAVDKPYVNNSGNITIHGQYFGATQGSGVVALDGQTTGLNVVSWSDTQIVINIHSNQSSGPHELEIRAADGQKTVNGLQIHVIRGTYQPFLMEVGPTLVTGPHAINSTNNPHAIQQALDAVANQTRALIVVYPNAQGLFNPFGYYNEEVIMHSPVKLQGVGPGGIYTDPTVPPALLNTYQPGSVIDGTGFTTDAQLLTDWQTELAGLQASIVQPAAAAAAIPDGEVILVVATRPTQYGSTYRASIDGFTIQAGDVGDFVAPISDTGGGPILFGEVPPDNAGITQGGGIFAFAATRYLQITNNIIRSNTGSYAGGIRIGTPNVGSNNVPGLHIAFNRVIANGGNNLAGAIGIFSGATGYELNNNDVCGNFSAEYGGGISHFGLSPNSSIHDNRVYFNGSYDEGAGIMIAGELPTTPTGLSNGAGAVDVYNNIIQANLGNDDGGGLRFLNAGNFPFNVYNNFIVNNTSTHEGGGISLNDAPNVRIFNNTVMKNLTTATAATSNGLPAPAGLSTGLNSIFLQASLPAGSSTFSNPLLFNNIFWDNRAGEWDGANIIGIGGTNQAGQVDPNPINYWDMGTDGAGLVRPTFSILQPTTNPGVLADPSNKLTDPLVKTPYNTTIHGFAWRGDFHFVAAVTIAQDVPITIMGDYHLSGTGSPANNAASFFKILQLCPSCSATTINAPAFDIDNQARPSAPADLDEIGADEISTAIPPLPALLSIFGHFVPIVNNN